MKPHKKHWPRLVLVVVFAAAIVSTLFAPARTVTRGDISATFETHEVTPDQELTVAIEAKAGLRVAIRSVTVQGLGATQVIKGREPHWGARIQTTLGDGRATDQLPVRLKIPSELVGQSTTVRLEVTYTTAGGYITFTNATTTQPIEVDVMVRSAFGHKLRRAFDWARLAIVWLVSIALLIWALGWLAKQDYDSLMPWLFCIHAALGLLWFAPHVLRLLGLEGWTARLVATACWAGSFAIAIIVLIAKEQRARWKPATIERVDPSPVPASALALALMGTGLHVIEKRRRLVVSRIGTQEEVIVELPVARVIGDAVDIRSTNAELGVTVVQAMTSILGPLRYRDSYLGDIIVTVQS